MISRERTAVGKDVWKTADSVTKHAISFGASGAEALVYLRDDTVVRFSQNNISQSVAYRDEGVQVRLFAGESGYSTVTIKLLDDEQAIERGIQRGLALAKAGAGNKNTAAGLSRVGRIPRRNSNFRRGSTEVADAEIARRAKKSIDTSLNVDNSIKRVAGTITSRVSYLAIRNSNGLDAYHQYTGASFVTAVLATENGSTGIGFSSQASNNLTELDFLAVSREAASDATSSVKPKATPMGRYDVIFYPYAVLDWLGSFVQLGFSTQRVKGYVEIGKQCASKCLSIVDDPTNPETLMAKPFDAEGTPTRKLTLIKEGLANAQCYDISSAQKAGTKSTGHCPFSFDLTYESKFFPAWIYLPANQIVNPGKSSLQDMIASSKRKTILVKRFMYGGLPMCVSETENMQAYTMGTWLVEDGRIVHSLPSLRLSNALSGLVQNISEVGDTGSVKRLGCMNVPCMKVTGVNFSLSTSMSVPQGVL